MAGHSKWSQIKRKKAALDAKRGAHFTKLIREITVAARQGGGDPDGNPRLRTAITTAKNANMPNDNIDRAVKKGTGELEGVTYEEILYEGYGPGGVAILVETATDNQNRTVAELRHIFSRRGGNLGAPGSVAWMFEKRGQITLERGDQDEEGVMEAALEAGAEDFEPDEESFLITTDPTALHEVAQKLEKVGFRSDEVQLAMVPNTTVDVAGDQAKTLLGLMEAIEEHDDVQRVFANFDIDSDTLAEVSG